MRGMPMLDALRDAGWSVWPFDAPSTHTLVEIYPRLFTGPVVKRDAASRAALLREHDVPVDTAFRNAMVSSEDAFDAGLSALEMSRRVVASPLVHIIDPIARIEGRIWVPGVE